jgi:hypothetical protein
MSDEESIRGQASENCFGVVKERVSENSELSEKGADFVIGIED